MNQNLASRYNDILARIHTAASTSTGAREVTLVAVSKTQPVEAIEELYHLGQRDFGESYVQEFLQKQEILKNRGCTGIRWHFIGHLQSNKVKALIPFVDAIHSLDRETLALELAKRWRSAGRSGRLPVFIEVNVDQEASKAGVDAAHLFKLVDVVASLEELELRGLMCIPSPSSSASGSAFRRLRELELQCRPRTGGQLSMGMTDDFEIAIREGATVVRIGTALFGPRNYG